MTPHTSPENPTRSRFSSVSDAYVSGRSDAPTTATDDAKRKDILHEAQTMQYEQGGYIIPYFSNIIDAYSAKVSGFQPAKSGFPFGNYWLKNVGFTSGT